MPPPLRYADDERPFYCWADIRDDDASSRHICGCPSQLMPYDAGQTRDDTGRARRVLAAQGLDAADAGCRAGRGVDARC